MTVASREMKGLINVLKSFRKLDIRRVQFESASGVENHVLVEVKYAE